MRRVILLLLVILTTLSIMAGKCLNFNESWKFKLGDQLGAEHPISYV